MELKQNLNNMTVSDLKVISCKIGLIGISKYRKSELVNVLMEKLLQPDTIKTIMLSVNEREYKNIKKIIKMHVAKVTDICPTLVSLGYAVLEEDTVDSKNTVMVLSEDFFKLTTITYDKNFYDERKLLQRVNKYICAFVALYGAIDYESANTLYHYYEHGRSDEADFCCYCNKLLFADQKYYSYKDYLVNRDVTTPADLIEQQQNKPYLQLVRSELLYYSDHDYIYVPAISQYLKEALVDHYNISLKEANTILEQIIVNFNYGADINSSFKILSGMNITFNDVRELDYFMGLLRQLYDNCRMWKNRGLTPNELKEAYNIA